MQSSFHALDWAIIALYLAAMAAIGFYFSRRQQNLDQYLLADRSMGWLPVGLSLMVAGLISAFWTSTLTNIDGWQRLYTYDVPLTQAPTLDQGDIVTLLCEYENTTDNPFVVEMLDEYGFSEPIDVGLGEHTLDEMCLSILGIATPL